MCQSNERALATKKRAFSRILHSVYLKICFHWLSFNLKLINVDIIIIIIIIILFKKKNSRTFKALKSDSRNSRVFKTHAYPV